MSPLTLQNGLRTKIIYYIADLPVPCLRLLTSKSDKITVPFASLRSPIILLNSSSFAFFDSLLRSKWDARLTSRITEIESFTRDFQPQQIILELSINARKGVKLNPHLCEHRINKNFPRVVFYVETRLKKSPLPYTNDVHVF